MTPKEKAKELVFNFYDIDADDINYGMEWKMAIQCALIAVDEVLKSNPCCEGSDRGNNFIWEDNTYYWQEVKQEIEKL